MSHIHELIDYAVVTYIVYQDKVLLAGHKQLNAWMPIGGHIELDENPEQALWREIKEETGLQEDDVEIIAERAAFHDSNATSLYPPTFMEIHAITDTHRHTALIYLARSKTDSVQLNPGEHYELRWFTQSDLQAEQTIVPSVRFYAIEALKRLGNSR